MSSQTLAIIANAEAENSFVGYAQTYVDDEGNKNYDYFDRYPVFFSAGMHIILSLKTKLSTQIYLAKQVMNLIFILTIAAAFALVNKIVRNRVIALSVVMLSVSSQYLLFYKDMIHYDQPALLGLIFLIYAITVYKIDGNRWLVYFAGLISISIGRGYASYSVLLIWLLVEALDQIKERGIPLRKKVRKIIRHDAFRVLLLAIAWGAICLLYNIGIEAARRGIPFIQTSIIQSATTRLALNKDFNDSHMNTLSWGGFIKDQMVRLIRWSFPIWNYKGTFLQNINILAIVFSIIGLYTRMLDSARKTVLLIMVFSGIFWLFIMRNLSAFHDYTAMYYIGIPLAFYAALFPIIKIPSKAEFALLIYSLVIFTYRDLQTQTLHYEIGRIYNEYTYDFIRINDKISGEGRYIYLTDGVPNAPYAPGFYLSDHYLAPLEIADYVISSNSNLLPDLLTPENERMFLFKK